MGVFQEACPGSCPNSGLKVTPNPFTWNGAYGYEWLAEAGLYHVGARAYDPRTARWLQRDPIDAASGDPNLYRYCGNDPVNWTDSKGFRPRRKPATEEECNKWLDEIEKKLKKLEAEMDKNERWHPVQDIMGGCPSGSKPWKPAGHSIEMESLLTHIDKLFRRLAEEGCYQYQIYERAGRLGERYRLLHQRIARWYAKLQELPKNILREIIEKYVKNPQSLRVLVNLLRRFAKFVPYLGQIITIIFFIYDWYQGGFWHAVKGLIATNSAVRSPFSVAIKPQSASSACFVPKRLMVAQGQQV